MMNQGARSGIDLRERELTALRDLIIRRFHGVANKTGVSSTLMSAGALIWEGGADGGV